MLDLLRKQGIGETLEAQVAKFSCTDAAANRLWKLFLASSSSMVAFVPFVRWRRKTDSAIEDMKYNIFFATK